MKHYFRYNNGYINIDKDNLYITKTGNWQEALEIKNDLSESRKITKRTQKTLLSVFIYLITIVYILLYTSKSWTTSIFAILIAIITELLISLLIERDFKKQAIIPLNKIESVAPCRKNNIKINFINRYDESNYEIVKGVEEKGIEFLMNLEF